MKLTSTHFIAGMLFMVLCIMAYKGVVDARNAMKQFAQQERERVSRETVKMKFGTPSEILEGEMK